MASAPAVASAQSWQNITGTSGGGTAFWDSFSNDGVPMGSACNIGAVLTNAAVPANCINQVPSNLLPLNLASAPNQYLGVGMAPATFFFGAGQWDISFLGSMTGGSPLAAWRIVDQGSNANLGTLTSAGSSVRVTSAAGIYLEIDPFGVSGTESSKTLSAGYSQFALFSKNPLSPTVNAGLATINWNAGDGQTYFVGMEDNACVPPTGCQVQGQAFYGPSDRDYNDMLIQVTSVPEPSTVVLMAAGLIGLMATARRRRSI
jgi:hypothetical protein